MVSTLVSFVCQSCCDLLIWRNFEFVFVCFLTEKINLWLVQQKTLSNRTLIFSVLTWFWGAESKQYQIFILQNYINNTSKFEITKSPGDIHTTSKLKKLWKGDYSKNIWWNYWSVKILTTATSDLLWPHCVVSYFNVMSIVDTRTIWRSR